MAVLRSEYYWRGTASEGNRTLMPRHPSQEIQTGTYHAILKKLGIKE